jgi:GMP synthase-like glutamine amidotransferase
MTIAKSEIQPVRIGVLQARTNTETLFGEQHRVRRAFSTRQSVRTGTSFIDTLDKRGIAQGRSVDTFLDQFDGLAVMGTSDMDEFHRDPTTKEGMLRHQYHNEVDPIIIKAQKREMPILGVCFGAHEIVVANFGEQTVKNVPKNRELGTVIMKVTQEGKSDPIVKDLPPKFDILSGHKGSIVEEELPEDAIDLIARTDRTPISLFKIKGTYSYGEQQHPEATNSYVQEVGQTFDMLVHSGLAPYTQTDPFTPPHSKTGLIFGNFAEIVAVQKQKKDSNRLIYLPSYSLT